MAALASSSSKILWQGDFVLANSTVFILFSSGSIVSTHFTPVSILSLSRRPLPLRLESRRASILSLSQFGLQEPLQVDWVGFIDHECFGDIKKLD